MYLTNIQTGLALEAKEAYEESLGEIEGVIAHEYSSAGTTITRVEVINIKGEEALGRKQGTYITVEFPSVINNIDENYNAYVEAVAREIKNLCTLEENDSVLVVGLGNRQITPDALGPLSINSIVVTRHLKEQLKEAFDELNFRQVSAISPGVLGQTGVETAEIIKGVVDRSGPKLIFAIDALASRRLKRLASTIQISNTGISPGGGVGNLRTEISKEIMGVPVISIGVPLVVDAATMTTDVVNIVAQNTGDKMIKYTVGEMEDSRYKLIRDALTPSDLNLFVTPKDIDKIVEQCAKLVADSINVALQDKLTTEDVLSITNH